MKKKRKNKQKIKLNEEWSNKDIEQDFQTEIRQFCGDLEIELPKDVEYNYEDENATATFKLNKRFISSDLESELKNAADEYNNSGGDFSVSVYDNDKEITIKFVLLGASTDEIIFESKSKFMFTSINEYKNSIVSNKIKINKKQK